MNDENNFCKYCLDDITENEQPIIYPCQCSDGVHENCLAIWLIVRSNTNDRYKCEICKTNYIGIIIPPPSPPAPPSPVQLVVPPPPPEIDNEAIAEHDQLVVRDEIAEHNEIRSDISADLEVVCCSCYKIECGAYIAGTVLSFSAFLMSVGQPNHRQPLHYYTGLTVLTLMACLSYVLSIALTGRRYYKRLQDIRTINAIATD